MESGGSYGGLEWTPQRGSAELSGGSATSCGGIKPPDLPPSNTALPVYPVSPPDNTFALPTEVFSSCLAIVSAVTVGGLFLWPAL